MLSKVGGRKIAITLLCLGAGVAIDIYTTRGLSTNLYQLMLGIIATYSIANVAGKFSSKAKGADSERMNQMEGYVSGLASQLENTNKQVGNANKRVSALLALANSQIQTPAPVEPATPVANPDVPPNPQYP